MKVRHTLFVVLASAAAGSLARADLPPSQGRDAPVSEEAKKYFKSGVDFLKDPDGARYEEAYAKFRTAYQISPSWRILGNYGLSAMKLERFGEAIEAYERYVAEGGNDIDKRERAQIDTDLRQMKLSAASVAITVSSSGDAVVLDQRLRANGTSALNSYNAPHGRPLKLMVAAGHHVLTAKADGKESRWETDLAAEKPSEHTFTFESAAPAAPAPLAATTAPTAPAATFSAKTEAEAPSSSGMRTAGFVGVGVGGAMLVSGVITGLIGKSKLSSLEDSCPNNRCAPDKQSDADSIHSLQTTTNILLIGGGVIAAAGVALVLVGTPSKPATSAIAPSRFSLAVAPAAGGIVAAGQF